MDSKSTPATSSCPQTSRRPYGHLGLLHTDPAILYASDWEVKDADAALWDILEQTPKRRLHLAISPSWRLSHIAQELMLIFKRLEQRFPTVSVSLLVHSANELSFWQTLGGKGVHCSLNALVRSDLFYPIADSEKKFDAVYDGKWADYKRHQLAAKVESLALIAYPLPQSCSPEYTEKVKPLLEHATWFTSPWIEPPPYLSSAQVNDIYNQARVGLCLSAIEGGMLASIQYQYAGLPVVTTHNTGGRNEFLDHAFARFVNDSPDAVAAAVAEFAKSNVPSEEIRTNAINKVREHRSRFLQWIQSCIDAEHGSRGRWSAWPDDLPDKLREPVAITSEVLQQLG